MYKVLFIYHKSKIKKESIQKKILHTYDLYNIFKKMVPTLPENL